MGTLNHWDQEFFLFLNSYHNIFFDYLMTVFTSEIFWVPLYLITVFVIGKKYGKKSAFIFISLGLLILCADQFAGIVKHSVQRLRPSHDPMLMPLTHIFHYKGGLYSFFSAHSANAFAYATFTILLFRNNIYTLFIIPWAILVAYTRIYLGLHFPGDILCGALSGIFFAYGIFRLMNFAESKISPLNEISKISPGNRQINLIIASGIFLIIIAVMIVNLLLNRQLLIAG